MSKDPPYSMGFLETIVNVHFGGLAVEFYKNGASYLVLSRLPDFSKAIISFWFRVSSATLQRAYDSWVPTGPDNPIPFNGMTPLVIFGDDGVKGYKIETNDFIDQTVISEAWTQNLDGSWHLRDDSPPGTTISTGHQTYEKGDDIPLAPCFIAIDSNREEIESYDPEDGGPPPKKNVLVMKLQMSTKPNASGVVPIKSASSFSGDQIFYQQQPGDSSGPARPGGTVSIFGPDYRGAFTFGIGGYNPFIESSDYTDETSTYMGSQPESFTVKLDNKEIKPNRWHIVTISFDVSGKVQSVGVQLPNVEANTHPQDFPDHGTIKSSCKAWVAFDDVNYKGVDIRDKLQFTSDVTSRLKFDPNGIYTPNSILTALTRQPANGSIDIALDGLLFRQEDSGFSVPQYNYTPGAIHASSFPFGIPVTEEFTDNGDDVEFAEFQMWVGKTLNTANTSSRRLFVDAQGKPVNPKVAAKALGTPAISLHGTGNWIKGKNLGTLGALDPTGEILKYRPDPSLHGPQSPSDLR